MRWWVFFIHTQIKLFYSWLKSSSVAHMKHVFFRNSFQFRRYLIFTCIMCCCSFLCFCDVFISAATFCQCSYISAQPYRVHLSYAPSVDFPSSGSPDIRRVLENTASSLIVDLVNIWWMLMKGSIIGTVT